HIQDRAAEYLPEGASRESLQRFIDNEAASYVTSGKVSEEYTHEAQALTRAYNDFSTKEFSEVQKALATVEERAAGVGINPEEFRQRLQVGADSAQQEQDWLVSDIEAVAKKQNWNVTNPEHVGQAVTIIDRIQDFAHSTMDEIHNARIEVEPQKFAATAQQVAKEMKQYKTAMFDGPESEKNFVQSFTAQYGQEGIKQLAQGRIEVLNDLTQDPQEQRDIAYTMFKMAEKHEVKGIEPETREAGLDAFNPKIWHGQGGHSI
ncbi:MAG: hypothetical protein ACK5JT_13920, partial [Hyphomicrobiaceae bacterium]